MGKFLQKKRVFNWIAFCVLILFLLVPTRLQASSSPQDEELSSSHFKELADIESQAISFLKDKDGFIYIGTYVDGLYKYDGKNLRHFTDTAEFSTITNISALLQDRDDDIWMVANGNGLVLTENGTNKLQHFRHEPENPDSLSSSSFYWDGKNVLMEDNRGFIWVGTIGGGLNRYDKSKKIFKHFTHDPSNPLSLSNDNIRSVYEDSQGIIWVGTEMGLNRMSENGRDFTRFTHDPDDGTSISDNTIASIFEDSSGRLWFGTESNGVNSLDDDLKSFTRYRFGAEGENGLASNYVNHISQGKDGSIWFAHQTQLTIFDPGTKKFVHFGGDFKDVTQVYHDQEADVVWALLDSGKLCIYDPDGKRFKLYHPEPGNSNSLSSEIVISIYEDSRKILWISTLGGLNSYNPKTGEFRHFLHETGNPKTIPSTTDYSPGLFEDSEGVFWVGNSVPASLSILNRETGEVEKTYSHNPSDPQSIPDAQQVNSIIQDKENPDYLWLGTFKGLVRFNKKTEKFKTYGSQTHWNIWEDDVGNIWVTTWGEGFARFNKSSEEFKYFRHDPQKLDSISDNLQVTLFVDSKKQIWVGSANGLNLFDPEKETFKRYSRDEGFPFDAIHSIGEDKQHRLWLGTNSGLAQFNPETEENRVFTREDGIQGSVFYANNGIMSSSGEMWFGGTKGMNSFFPEEIRINKKKPEIKLTTLKQGGQNVYFGKATEYLTEIQLDWKSNFFEFEFVALDYTNPQKNQYAYKLEGVDQDWFYSGTQNFGRYSGLKPGRYVLRMKGSNNDGVWNEIGQSLVVEVLPPFWETWWFYSGLSLLAVIIILVAVYYMYKLNSEIGERKKAENSLVESNLKLEHYNERLQKLDKLKDEFMANTSHELRTPLTGIIGLAESLIEGSTGALPEKTVQTLSMIVGSGKRLSNLVNDILDFSKLRHKDLQLKIMDVDCYSLASVILAISAPIARAKPLKLENRIPEDVPFVLGDESRLQQILFNLVGNAIKFTEKGTISISAREFESCLEISVTDEGIGIPEDSHQDIFKSFEQLDGSVERQYGGTGLGLAVSKDLVELHGGSIGLESNLGKGTRFYFTIPFSPNKKLTEENQENKRELQAVDLQQEGLPIVASVSNIDLNAWAKDKINILVVDDEAINLQVVEDQLSLNDYEVTLVSNGTDALNIIEELEKENITFDLVLLDIMMPGISGYEVCRKIREKFPCDVLPVIMLTAKNRPEDLVAGFEAGASDYLEKPFSSKELLARIRNQYDLKMMMDQHQDDMKALRESKHRLNKLFEERKQAAEELGNLRNYLANIIDSMPSLLVGVNSDGTITQWNSEAEQRIGLSTEEAVGKSLKEAIPHLASMMVRVDEAIQTRKEQREARRVCFKEGTRSFEDVTIYPLVANGVQGAVIRIDDVTEQVRLEEMIIQNEKMLSVGGLAAGMAHEINNPLAGMIQTANVLASRLGKRIDIPANRKAAEAAGISIEAIQEFMEGRDIMRMIATINESGKRVAAIVENMLSFARTSDAQVSSHDLAGLMDKTLELAATDCNLKKHYAFRLIVIKKEYEENMPPVPCEPANIQQVLLNILSNGSQAMQEAGTETPTFTLRIRNEKEQKMACMEIEDNGPGMEESVRNRVFEPFFTTKPVGMGTGLGLSVSYFIINENHHGELAVESRPGAGAKFIIRLPLDGGIE